MEDDHVVIRPAININAPWLAVLMVVILMAAVLADLAEDVWFREGFAWDAPIILFIHQFHQPLLDVFMRAVSWSGDLGAILLASGLAGWFIAKHRWIDAAAIVTVFGSVVALNTAMKLLFTRPRPALFPPLAIESGFSFPSAHVAASTATYGFLAVLLWQNKHRLLALLSGLWVLMVAVSRIYLGVHYPSDTLAALIMGSLLIVVIFICHDWYLRRMPNDIRETFKTHHLPFIRGRDNP